MTDARADARTVGEHATRAGVAGGVRPTVPSLLSRRVTWRLLIVWAISFGLITWDIEALLLQVVPSAPPEPWHGVFRFVEVILWIGVIVIAVSVAERWPIDNARTQWRRVLGQVTLGVALGPVWGAIAFMLSIGLIPSWRPRGFGGIVATEAKGALFGYGMTLILAHVILRTLKQQAREVAAAETARRATEARLNLLKLELQPDVVLRAMDAVTHLIPRDVAAANDALVVLAETLRHTLVTSHVRDVTLREELAITQTFVELRELTRSEPIALSLDGARDSVDVLVPHLILWPLVDAVLEHAAGSGTGPPRVVTIVAAQHAARLTLTITTSGGGSLPDRPLAARRGVTHTRERVEGLFGNTAALRVVSLGPDDEAVTIEMRLPIRNPSQHGWPLDGADDEPVSRQGVSRDVLASE